MNPLRIPDGYMELAVVDGGTVAEVFIADSEGAVTKNHLTPPIAIRFAWWIVKWWFRSKWRQFRVKRESSKTIAALNS